MFKLFVRIMANFSVLRMRPHPLHHHAVRLWQLEHFPPENFKTFHKNFDICRNFQRIKMKFYILITKICILILKIFRNAVCVYALVLLLPIFLGREFAYIFESSTINIVLLSHQWSKVCSQDTMPGDRHSIL